MTTPIPLHPRPQSTQPPPPPSPLPHLLHTPLGLALLELQGGINFPDTNTTPPDSPTTATSPSDQAPAGVGVFIGRLTFPDYVEGTTDTAWMKRVYLFVGENQRLGGEVKKLAKAVGVVRRRGGEGEGEEDAELEVVDIVKYKICFTNRPEPVEGGAEGLEGGEGGMDVDG